METTRTDGPTRTSTRTSTRRRRPAVGLALVAIVALLGMACGDDGGGNAATSRGGGGGGGGGNDLSISVTDPADGAQVSSPFELKLDSSVPLGEPDTGRHHVHLYYDGNTADGEYDLVYGTTAEVERLGPGEHTIEAVIANADHSLTDARAELTVMVGEGSGGGGASTSTTSTTETGGSGGGYGY